MTTFLTANSTLPPYMAFPSFLLDCDFSETTKLLYMVLLNRARLSQKNDGWIDKKGHVFSYFTIEDMAATLRKSQTTIKTSLSALEQVDLICRARQGTGNPNRIYVKVPADFSTQTAHDRLDGVCDLAVLHGIDISVLFVEDMVDGFQQGGVGQLLLLKNITESLGTERVGV